MNVYISLVNVSDNVCFLGVYYNLKEAQNACISFSEKYIYPIPNFILNETNWAYAEGTSFIQYKIIVSYVSGRQDKICI